MCLHRGLCMILEGKGRPWRFEVCKQSSDTERDQLQGRVEVSVSSVAWRAETLKPAGVIIDATKYKKYRGFYQMRYWKTCIFICKSDLLDHFGNISRSPASAVHSQIFSLVSFTQHFSCFIWDRYLKYQTEAPLSVFSLPSFLQLFLFSVCSVFHSGRFPCCFFFSLLPFSLLLF